MINASPMREGFPLTVENSSTIPTPTERKRRLVTNTRRNSSLDLSNSSTPKRGPYASFQMSKLLIALLVLCSIFSVFDSVSGDSKNKSEKRVVCYYTNWSAYRQGPAKFLPDNINPYLCTHLVYAFGGLTSDSGIKPFDKYQDIDKGGYTKFNGLKTYNKALKTLIAIGGWNEGSRRFSNLVADSESRKNFIRHAIRFMRQYSFDGLDLDWEYPASREGGVPEDKKNYAQFIKELRESFEDESKSTGRTRLLLTVAVPAGIEWIQKGFDIPVINKYIDFFNLLTYDYHASTEPNANHHAPLKAKDGLSDYDWKSQLNIEYTINHYLKEGADPDKLVVGLPTYGRSYNLFNVDSYDIDAPSSGPGTKGKFTKEPGYLAYYEICEGVKSGEWRVENGESDAQGPHAVKGDQWVGYDDTRMMTIKSKWIKEMGLGGIMFWSIDNDDFRGSCHNKPFPLIEAAKLAYITGDSPSRLQSSSTNSKPTKTSIPNRNTNRFTNNRRVTTPAPPSTTTGATAKSRRNKNRRNKNKKLTTALFTPSTTTTEAPTTFNPLNTPAPPTTPDPGVDFECKEDGFFPHPRECKKYFWCLDAPGLGLVAHHFTCPAGLFFNKNSDSCDYARNVPCKDKKAGDVTTAAPTTTTTKAPTTTARTTTTTTTEAPEEEYDDDEEYEDEEEEVEKPVVKSGKNTKTEKDNGRSVQEINDIKDLLKLIRKLGGVEELEKYLNDNPSVAAVIENEFDDDDDEEEDKPVTKATTSSSLFNRNRFSPSASPGRSRFGTSSSSNNSPVAVQSLKYTSIQRNRPVTTEKSATSTTETESSNEDEDSVPKKKTSSLFSSSRPKYVTLSRNTNKDSKSTENKITPTSTEKTASSSTETSIVVRFSGDDEKLLDEISNGKNTSSDSDKKTKDDLLSDEDSEYEDDIDNDSDGKTNSSSNDRYVTVSRPYAKVFGTSSIEVPVQASNNKRNAIIKESPKQSSSNRLRYVQLSRTKNETPLEASKNKKEVAATLSKDKNDKQDELLSSEEKDEDNYESEEDPEQSIVEQGETTNALSSTTTTSQATTTTESPTTKSRLRIPTRKTNGFAARSRGTTPSTSRPSRVSTTPYSTTSVSENAVSSDDNRKARNFAVGNRRNLFLSRTRATSSSTPIPDAASSQTANDESITEVVELVSKAEAISRRLDQRIQDREREDETISTTKKSTPRTKSRSISGSTATSSSTNVIPTIDRADVSNLSRSRSRYRSTTEQSILSSQQSPTTVAPITFRRRLRSSTTTESPTTTTTTKKPTTTTPKVPSTTNKKAGVNDDEEETEYYYYYYDEDQDEANSSSVLPKDAGDLFDKSQTQRTTGLRTSFSTGGNVVLQVKPKVEVTSTSIQTHGDRGFTKRNLQTQNQIKSTSVISNPNLNLNANSFNPGLSYHKWSERAVIPLSEKIKLRDDGTVECLDKGIFPHPISCKQFVHCVNSEENDGSLRAWVYACPKSLTFDPIGGMCNYDEFANSKRAPGGNACIE